MSEVKERKPRASKKPELDEVYYPPHSVDGEREQQKFLIQMKNNQKNGNRGIMMHGNVDGSYELESKLRNRYHVRIKENGSLPGEGKVCIWYPAMYDLMTKKPGGTRTKNRSPKEKLLASGGIFEVLHNPQKED